MRIQTNMFKILKSDKFFSSCLASEPPVKPRNFQPTQFHRAPLLQTENMAGLMFFKLWIVLAAILIFTVSITSINTRPIIAILTLPCDESCPAGLIYNEKFPASYQKFIESAGAII